MGFSVDNIMNIYIIIWTLICLFGIIFVYSTKNYKIFLFLSFLIMALVLGFRGNNVGEDTQMYLSIANATEGLSFMDILSEFPESTWSVDIHGYHNKVETFYLLFNKLIIILTGEAQWILIITALISCFGFAKFIYDNSSDIFISTYVFLCESIFMNAFNITRQTLAMSIAINSYTCIKNKEYIKALFLILIASLFHKSALIYLFLFLIFIMNNKGISSKYILIGCIVITQSIPILYKIVMKFSPYYASYFQDGFWKASANGIIILWIFEWCMLAYMCFKGIKNIDEYMIVACTSIYLSIEIIALKYTGISRIALYFKPFILLLFTMFKKYFKKKDRFIYIIFIFTILAILYFKSAGSTSRIYSTFMKN